MTAKVMNLWISMSSLFSRPGMLCDKSQSTSDQFELECSLFEVNPIALLRAEGRKRQNPYCCSWRRAQL